MRGNKLKKILAVASTGGHWLQLQRLRPAFEGCDVVYVSTADYQGQLKERQYRVRDANQWDKVGLLIMAVQVLFVILRTQPDVVITTGAAPGFFALFFARLFGKKTIWIDSIANSEEMSLAGKKSGKYADLYLTQWPEVASPEGPHYKGAVL